MAIAQFWPNWSAIAVVPIIFVVGQTIADYVLSPYLVGRRVNLHPVWMIFALFAFGYVFGFVGLLLAVPLAAACRVLLHFALEQYYASPLYAAPPNAAQPVVVALAETKPSIKKPDDASSSRRGPFLGVVPPQRGADPDHDDDR